jgi:alkylated DNA nucleotide flippase Atl1
MRGQGRSRELEVLERVRAIPEGFVATYGDMSPGAPRFAGAVLYESVEPDLPWWRVVRGDGSLAKGARQRRLLVGEGVPFRGERVDMKVARTSP